MWYTKLTLHKYSSHLSIFTFKLDSEGKGNKNIKPLNFLDSVGLMILNEEIHYKTLE